MTLIKKQETMWLRSKPIIRGMASRKTWCSLSSAAWINVNRQSLYYPSEFTNMSGLRTCFLQDIPKPGLRMVGVLGPLLPEAVSRGRNRHLIFQIFLPTQLFNLPFISVLHYCQINIVPLNLILSSSDLSPSFFTSILFTKLLESLILFW